VLQGSHWYHQVNQRWIFQYFPVFFLETFEQENLASEEQELLLQAPQFAEIVRLIQDFAVLFSYFGVDLPNFLMKRGWCFLQ